MSPQFVYYGIERILCICDTTSAEIYYYTSFSRLHTTNQQNILVLKNQSWIRIKKIISFSSPQTLKRNNIFILHFFHSFPECSLLLYSLRHRILIKNGFSSELHNITIKGKPKHIIAWSKSLSLENRTKNSSKEMSKWFEMPKWWESSQKNWWYQWVNSKKWLQLYKQ